MTSKHTPGEWEAVGDFVRAKYTVICRLSELYTEPVIGYRPVDYGSPHEEEIAANGRLIAAAPELLEAIKPLIDAASNLYRQLESVEEFAYYYQSDLRDLKRALFDAKKARAQVEGEKED